MVRPKCKYLDVVPVVPIEFGQLLDKAISKYGGKCVYVIALRGYYMDTMGAPGVNDRGIYDDAMCVVYPGGFVTYNANTDPSKFRPATENRQGMATLIPGLHFLKQGKHGITTHADGGYDAFRPATPDESLPVWRDGQDWGVKVFKGIAINLHKGGYNTTSSEGCQTVHPDQWAEFQVQVYHLMDKYKQSVLPYLLVNWAQ